MKHSLSRLFACFLPFTLFSFASAQPSEPTLPDTACCEPAAPAKPCSHWIGGGSFYYLKPSFSSNPAFTTTTGAGTPNTSASTTALDWNYNPAGSAWIGVVNSDGFGLRARGFRFDDSSNAQSVVLSPTDAATTTITGVALPGLPLAAGGLAFGAPGTLQGAAAAAGLAPTSDNLTFNSELEILHFDFEALWTREWDAWLIQFSAGGRYLHLEQSYTAQLTNSVSLAPLGVAASAVETQSLTSQRRFSGGGPTLGLSSIYCLGGGFSVFGQARTSLLAGTQSNDFRFSQLIADPSGQLVPGGTNISAVQSNTQDTILPVLEVEAGIEFVTKVCGKRALLIRVSGVNQTYFGAGSATQTSGDFGLIGGQVTAGLRF